MRKRRAARQADYIWNTAAGLLNASEAVAMSMIVTRTAGTEEAGILTTAFAVGNLMMSIGKYGIRNYQATDMNGQFSFRQYFYARIMTVFLMMAAASGYLWHARTHLGYSFHKSISVLMICFIYMVEALEDVFWGYYQRNGFLRVGAGMFCARWTGILACFGMIMHAKRSMAAALSCSAAVSAVIFAAAAGLTFPRACRPEDRERRSLDPGDIGGSIRLAGTAFPLFCASFLSFYILNAPKYAVDACMDSRAQACFGFAAMPIFVIGLLNGFVYQPALAAMALEWRQGMREKFVRRMSGQLFVLAVITGVCLAGAKAAGIPVLSWLYSTDLSAYEPELLVMLAAGGFLAGSGYLGAVLTVMRCQSYLLWGYAFTAAASFFTIKKAVVRFGTMGAAVSYLAATAVLFFIFLFIFFMCMKFSRKQKRNRGQYD